MNIQLLINQDSSLKPIKDFFNKKKSTLFSNSTIAEFFQSCIENPSNVFIIQSGLESEIQILGFIKDLRVYFGAFPLIFILGDKGAVGNSTNCLNVGADNILDYPYDIAVLEDLLGHRLQRDTFLPIHYRNVPSGGSPVQVTRAIELTQICSEGIEFTTTDFITRGALIGFEIGKYISIGTSSIQCKVLTSTINPEDEIYSYYAEYFEITDELKKEIRFKLKEG